MDERDTLIKERLEMVLNNLNTHYLKLDFTTKTWANQSNVSVAYLSRFLREQTGKPASVHLSEKRLARAKELLIDTENKILSIAMASGFNDNNYFSRVFKKNEGVSPTEWREAYTKKGKLEP
jgi:two-component system, response regulator YesN